MKNFLLALLLMSAGLPGYEIPKEASSVSELERVLTRAKGSAKPVAFVVAIKTQPET
ncbi:MAG: hypothetical protein Q7Q71_08945 [Verrucomicrobiota bacterium JB023]|nr:hypothetical protein [Verrucomicrobiota bacterium JB023]